MLRKKAKSTSGVFEEADKFRRAIYLNTITVAVLGDSGVGKSSIIRHIVGEAFIHEHVPTVEEFYVKQMTYRNKTCEIHIIDTSGTYEFPAMRRIAIQKSDAAILVYSLDKPGSFTKLERLMDEIESCCADRNRRIPVIIVSNKTDLPNLSEPTFVTTSGERVSACDHLEGKWKCQWLPSSARFNLNIDVILPKLLDKLSPEKTFQRNHSHIWKRRFRSRSDKSWLKSSLSLHPGGSRSLGMNWL